MPDILGRLDAILGDMMGGLSLKDSSQDCKKAIQNFLRTQGLDKALQTWNFAARNFLDSLDEFLESRTDDAARICLEGLLRIMWVKFLIDSEFSQNIQGFSGKYRFCSRSGAINIPVEFADGAMRWPDSPGLIRRVWSRLISRFVRESQTPGPKADVTVEFKNGGALIKYLFNYGILKKRDLLGSVLSNEIKPVGNLNYLFKFAFLANHMLLEVSGDLP